MKTNPYKLDHQSFNDAQIKEMAMQIIEGSDGFQRAVVESLLHITWNEGRASVSVVPKMTLEEFIKGIAEQMWPGENVHVRKTKQSNWQLSYSNQYSLQHGDGEQATIPAKLAEIMYASSIAPVSPETVGVSDDKKDIFQTFDDLHSTVQKILHTSLSWDRVSGMFDYLKEELIDFHSGVSIEQLRKAMDYAHALRDNPEDYNQWRNNYIASLAGQVSKGVEKQNEWIHNGTILFAIDECVVEGTPTLIIGKGYEVDEYNEELFTVRDERDTDHYFTYHGWNEYFTLSIPRAAPLSDVPKSGESMDAAAKFWHSRYPGAVDGGEQILRIEEDIQDLRDFAAISVSPKVGLTDEAYDDLLGAMDFYDYVKNTRREFVETFLRNAPTTKERVNAENLLICFDQMRTKLFDSLSVEQPVKQSRESLQNLENELNTLARELSKPALKAALSLPATGEKSDGWIKCSERMPEYNEDCLLYMGPNDQETGTFKGKDAWLSFRYDAFTTAEVTHWMPLPNDPENKEEKI